MQKIRQKTSYRYREIIKTKIYPGYDVNDHVYTNQSKSTITT